MSEPTTSKALTSSVEGSPARTSVTPERELDSQGLEVGFGMNTRESFARWDQLSCSWRTSQRCLLEGWATFSARFPTSGMIRSGQAFELIGSVLLNPGPASSLSPWPHREVHVRYFIKTPSMLRAIPRGFMSLVATKPTLTTKIIERAPCPYWETELGPRYLTESEAEMIAGFPIGWTDTRPSETPSSPK